MKLLSIIIPAYDEAATIAIVIEQIDRCDTEGYSKEIIVIDDGSADDTAVVARAALDRLSDGSTGRLVLIPQNAGKGAAVRRGFAASTGELVIVQDADLEYDPADLARMLGPIRNDRADVVMGSRFIGGRPRRVVYLSNAIGNRAMSAMFSVLSGLRLTDIHSCYMMLPGDLARAAAPLLRSARWGFNPEICSLLADWRNDVRIVEVGISYYGRSKREGKKIRMRHGVVAISEIIRYNTRPARRWPLGVDEPR